MLWHYDTEKAYRTEDDFVGSCGGDNEKPATTPTPTAKPTASAVLVPTAKPTSQPTSGTLSDDVLKRHKYVGSAESDKYHYTSCRHAKKILTENAIFFTNVEEAEAMGYSPCGVCKPG